MEQKACTIDTSGNCSLSEVYKMMNVLNPSYISHMFKENKTVE